jgi:hypothetical protein
MKELWYHYIYDQSNNLKDTENSRSDITLCKSFLIFFTKIYFTGKRKYYFLRASLPTSSVDMQGNIARWLSLLYPGDSVQNCCLLHQKIP